MLLLFKKQNRKFFKWYNWTGNIFNSLFFKFKWISEFKVPKLCGSEFILLFSKVNQRSPSKSPIACGRFLKWFPLAPSVVKYLQFDISSGINSISVLFSQSSERTDNSPISDGITFILLQLRFKQVKFFNSKIIFGISSSLL